MQDKVKTRFIIMVRGIGVTAVVRHTGDLDGKK